MQDTGIEKKMTTIYMYDLVGYFAVQQNFVQHCKSTMV